MLRDSTVINSMMLNFILRASTNTDDGLNGEKDSKVCNSIGMDSMLKGLHGDQLWMEVSMVINSLLRDSTLINSLIRDSSLINSLVRDSTMIKSLPRDSTVINSLLRDSMLINSLLRDSTVINSG